MNNKSIAKVNIENEEEYLKWCKSLKVDFKTNDYVALIIDHSKEIEKRNLRKNEKYKEYLPFEIQCKLNYKRYPDKRAVLNIDVSNKQGNRAYKFMNCFIEAIQAIGGYVCVDYHANDNTVIRFSYCTFECSLTEKRGRYRDFKPVEIKTMKPSYEIIDTGKLIFKIAAIDKNQKSFNEIVYDEDKKPLHEQIRDIFVDFRPIYIDITKNNIEIESIKEKEADERNRQWLLEREKEKAEKESKEQQEIREKRQNTIELHIKKWEYLNKIETYISEITKYAEKKPEDKKEQINIYCNYIKTLFNKDEFFDDIDKFTL